jgi:hypothetical protein
MTRRRRPAPEPPAPARAGEWFRLRTDHPTPVAGTPLALTAAVRREYGGHRFEELGDRIVRTLRADVGERRETRSWESWERTDGDDEDGQPHDWPLGAWVVQHVGVTWAAVRPAGAPPLPPPDAAAGSRRD